MSKQERDYNAEFQDRIDELMLLERKASERARSFLAANRENQQQIQGSVSSIVQNAANIKEIVNKCAYYKPRVLLVIFGTAMLAVLMFGGATWYISHAKNKVTELQRQERNIKLRLADYREREVLKSFSVDVRLELKRKPIFTISNGAIYVKVKPSSEARIFKNGRHLPGIYAEVQTKR